MVKTVINSRQATLMATVSVMLVMMLMLTGCGGTAARLTTEETELVMSSDGLMRVLLVTSREDSLLLRKHCTDLTAEDLQSEVYDRLARRMVTTVDGYTAVIFQHEVDHLEGILFTDRL